MASGVCYGNMMITVEVEVACVMGCGPRWMTLDVLMGASAKPIVLPACVCGSEVLLVSAVRRPNGHDVMFTPSLSPSELRDFLFEAAIPPAEET